MSSTSRTIDVVIVDAHADTVDMMCDAFRATGWRARGFRRPDAAWLAMLDEPPDLVVVTIGAHSLDALELAYRIRRSRSMEAVAIIAISCCPLTPGNPLFDEMLTKPIDVLDTATIVRRLVRDARSSRTVARRERA